MLRIRALIFAVVVVTALFLVQSASSTFSGANGKIVFFSQHAGEDEIWVMNADGSDRQNLTRHRGVKISDIDPSWSPDGDEIAFASGPTGGSLQIYVMHADGSNLRKLTDLPGRNRFPSWTANGQQIVFQSFVAGQFEIYRMNADGTGVVNLTNNPAVDWSPATSSRGKKVVFTSERDGNGHLYVMDAGGELRRITNTAGYDAHASWSPRGNDVVFVREDANGADLYAVHTDGTQERRLTNTPDQSKLFPTFSPDGSKVAYSTCTDPPAPRNPNPTCSTRVLDLATGEEVDMAFPGVDVPNPFADDFDEGRDVELWSVIHDGKGASIDWTNGRVEITFAPDAQAYPGSTQIGVHTGFHCVLLGDFDASVDYELLQWPAANNVLVFLNAFFANASIGRDSRPWGEQYVAFVAQNFGSASTIDQSGSLRLVRAAGVMTAYYRNAGAWVTLASAPADPNPAVIALVGAANSGSFVAQPVKVAFDNFRLDAAPATRDCSSWRADLNPDWQAITAEDEEEDDDD